MFSTKPPAPSSISAGQDALSTGPADEQNLGQPRMTRRRRRRGAAWRRLAIGAAVALGVACGSAAITTVAANPPGAAARGSRAATTARVRPLAERYASFEHRARALEARGYIDVACMIGGDRFFNPRTHRYLMLRL
jgi:hypothetical protein